MADGSFAATRTIAGMPAAVAARIIPGSSAAVMGACSQSITTQFHPASPIISTDSGQGSSQKTPVTTRFSRSLWRSRQKATGMRLVDLHGAEIHFAEQSHSQNRTL